MRDGQPHSRAGLRRVFQPPQGEAGHVLYADVLRVASIRTRIRDRFEAGTDPFIYHSTDEPYVAGTGWRSGGLFGALGSGGHSPRGVAVPPFHQKHVLAKDPEDQLRPVAHAELAVEPVYVRMHGVAGDA